MALSSRNDGGDEPGWCRGKLRGVNGVVKNMRRYISRRTFLKKGAIALGAFAVYDVTGIVCAKPTDRVSTASSPKLKEKTMPHVIVKLYPGRSEQQKIQLAEAIVKDVVAIMECGEESVSVAIEEIKPEDWAGKVYNQDILHGPGKLYKKPGYFM